MKREMAVNRVDASESFETRKFRVEAGAEMFKLISDSLYSRPIEAIVRELSCNAYDSHVKRGNPDEPFQVKIPNSLSPDFYVRDFGTGLTPDEIENLYTVVFKSDKTETNDFIGCFGVGSKSPFSYTPQFSVESVVGGVKWIYSVFMDEKNIPCIADMSKGGIPTDERDGLKVSFNVERRDFNRFMEAAKRVIPYFSTRPDVLGMAPGMIQDLNYMMESQGKWGLVSQGRGRAIMGNVAYDLDTQQAGITADFDLYFDLGVLTPAASREYLQYDARTKEVIKKAYDEAMEELTKNLQSKVDSCSSVREARLLYCNLMANFRYNHIVRSEIDKLAFHGNRGALSSNISLKCGEMWCFRNGRRTIARNIQCLSMDHARNTYTEMDVYLIYPDKDNGKYTRAEHFSSKHPDALVYVPKDFDDEDFEQAVKDIGLEDDHVLLSSKMESPPPSARQAMGPSRKARVDVLRFEGPRSRIADCWSAVDEPPKKLYYINVNHYKCRLVNDGPHEEPSFVRTIQNLLARLGWELTEVYGVKNRSWEDAKKEKGWVNLKEEIIRFLDHMSSDESVKEIISLRGGHLSGEHHRLKFFSEKASEIKDPQVKKFLELWGSYHDSKRSIDALQELALIVNHPLVARDSQVDLAGKYQKILDTYPLLHKMGTYERDTNHYLIYMNAVYLMKENT